MGTRASIKCGDKYFYSDYDGYISGLGRALSSACNQKQSEGLETLEQFAEYLKNGFEADYGYKMYPDGGGEYRYTIEMTGPGGFWVSVIDKDGEYHDDSEQDYWWSDSYDASAKKSKNIKKEGNGKKCVNYLDLPVCPECGSPNLHELEFVDGVMNCKCDRCDALCWFDDSFDTVTGADRMRFRLGASSKKSKDVPKFNDMVKAQRDKNIRKATPTDMRDAEIFGQIAGLLEQLSVKNRKNLGDLLATYSFGHTRPEDIVNVFNKARSIIENGEEQWW